MDWCVCVCVWDVCVCVCVCSTTCVADCSLLVSQIRLRLGEYDFSNAKEPLAFVERAASKKIVHPKYNFFTYEYDLALVRLEEAVDFQPNIAPICLPAVENVNLVGMNATVTGWGRLSEGGTLPSKLQQVRPHSPIQYRNSWAADRCLNRWRWTPTSLEMNS